MVYGGESKPGEGGHFTLIRQLDLMTSTSEHTDLMADLTEKQRAVLDLLLLHKTSKEIARALDISPYTVDQRIVAARQKFGVQTRSELAVAYGQLVSENPGSAISQGLVYQSSQVDFETNAPEKGVGSRESAATPEIEPDASNRDERRLPVVQHRVVPEAFEGRYGYFWRMSAILGFTLIFLIAVLVGFSIFGQLSEMLR